MLGSIQLRRARVALLPAAALMVFGTASAGVAQGATQTFSFTGGEQQFFVPPGVTKMNVVAIGGKGGNGDGSEGGAGGFGARAVADLSVNPGQLFYIEVGGNGNNGHRRHVSRDRGRPDSTAAASAAPAVAVRAMAAPAAAVPRMSAPHRGQAAVPLRPGS